MPMVPFDSYLAVQNYIIPFVDAYAHDCPQLARFISLINSKSKNLKKASGTWYRPSLSRALACNSAQFLRFYEVAH